MGWNFSQCGVSQIQSTMDLGSVLRAEKKASQSDPDSANVTSHPCRFPIHEKCPIGESRGIKYR